jgi:hypothetical protein
VQIRLPGFDADSLVELGARVRSLYLPGASDPERLGAVVDDAYVAALAASVAGQFGGRVGVAPRIFVKKLVDVLDRVDQHPAFDPRRDYALTVAASELTDVERAAMPVPPTLAPASTVDDIERDL